MPNNKNAQEAVVSKVDRRRFKKLRKRSDTPNLTQTLSGLVTESDAVEYHELNSQTNDDTIINPVVTVDWKNGKERTSGIHAISHRNLLLHLMPDKTSSTTNAGSKRKRDETAKTSIFGWASVHNPALLSQIAVVEVHYTCAATGEAAAASVAKFTSRLQTSITKPTDGTTVCGNKAVSIPTTWFHANANKPSSIADVLMYKDFQVDSTEPFLLSNEDYDTSVPIPSSAIASILVQRLLDSSQRVDNGYPQPSSSCSTESSSFMERKRDPRKIPVAEAVEFCQAHRVPTKVGDDATKYHYIQSLASSDQAPRVFAIDCEMLETTEGIELGRITVCQLQAYSHDDSSKQRLDTLLIMDEFVKPQHPVVDYKTQYSGLTADLLSQENNVATLEQIQTSLLQRIHSADILIGHSLENDLHAIQWIHETIVDTAVLFQPRLRRTKFSLKHLAHKLLGKRIQQPGTPHCSQEDAQTALELAVRRAVEGPSFSTDKGKCSNNWLTRMTSVNTDNTVCAFGPSAWLKQHILSTSNVVHAVEFSSVDSHTAGLVQSRLANQSSMCVWTSLSVDDESAAEQVSTKIAAWASSMSSTTVMLVAIQVNFSQANRASSSRAARKSDVKATLPWTAEAEQEWMDAMSTSQNGHVLWVSKTKGP